MSAFGSRLSVQLCLRVTQSHTVEASPLMPHIVWRSLAAGKLIAEAFVLAALMKAVCLPGFP